MPCYDTIVYRTYPKGCATTEPSPFTLPLASDDLYYAGPNLPYTGIQTEDNITEALQRIDNLLDPSGIYSTVKKVEFIIFPDELRTIQTTPKLLINKPGSGYFIRVLRALQKQITQTVDYTSGGSFSIEYAPSNSGNIFLIGSLRQASEYPKSYMSTSSLTYAKFSDRFLNQDVVLKNTSSLSATGDTYLKLKLEYIIEQFP